MTNDLPRFRAQFVHMTVGDFEIRYYDSKTKLEHTVHGFTSLIDSEVFQNTLGPAFNELIASLRDRSMAIHALGDPYPEALIEGDQDAS